MRKIALHLAFWLAYWFIYAYTNSRYDGNLPKYLLSEGLQMPARMLATYGSFWLLDRRLKHSMWAFAGIALATVAGGMLNRLVKLWYLVPAFFPDATIKFWDTGRLIIDIFDCALATGTALTARLYFRQQEGLQREERLRREKTEVELAALKSQLQPHFLFNTINNLYALARMKSDKTAPVALQLANLLRFVLYETRKPNIPLRQEIKILEDYIALEQLRFDDDRLNVQIHVEMDDPEQPITPLLLLPLVENAFKHGVGEHRTDAWVRLDIQLRAGLLRMEVQNSVERTVESTPGGIGIANVRRQLELLYPERGRLNAGPAGAENDTPSFSAVLEVRL